MDRIESTMICKHCGKVWNEAEPKCESSANGQHALMKLIDNKTKKIRDAYVCRKCATQIGEYPCCPGTENEPHEFLKISVNY